MANTKISALTAGTTPLAGTEVLPIVQSGVTKQVSVANLTAGRDVTGLSFTGGNIKISANQITSTDTNGNIYVVANGTGRVVLGSATPSSFAWSGIQTEVRDGLRIYDSSSSSFGLRIGFSSNVPYLQGYRETVGVTNITLQKDGGDVTIGAGNIIQGTAAKGINFTANSAAAGMTSQLLNWYEDGTFTPTLVSGSGTITSYTASGSYTRIGRSVTVSIYIKITNNGTGASYLRVSGLPYTIGQNGASGAVYESQVSGNTCIIQAPNGGTLFYMYTYNNGYPGATNAQFNLSFTYLV